MLGTPDRFTAHRVRRATFIEKPHQLGEIIDADEIALKLLGIQKVRVSAINRFEAVGFGMVLG